MSPNRRASLTLGKVSLAHRSAETFVDDGLRHKNWLGRWRAIQVIRQTRTRADRLSNELLKRADNRCILDLAQRASDEVAEVRLAAMEAMLELCPKGNVIATDAFGILLKDDWELIRAKAAEGLTALANRGDDGTIQRLLSALKDADAVVRRSALHALSALGKDGDDRIVNGALRALRDDDAGNREAALQVLQLFGTKGHAPIIEGVERLLQDESPRLRQLAVSYVSKDAADPADPSCTRILLGQLRSPERDVHRVALLGMLARLAKKGERVRSTTLHSLTTLPAIGASTWRSNMGVEGARAREQTAPAAPASDLRPEEDERALAEAWAREHWQLRSTV